MSGPTGEFGRHPITDNRGAELPAVQEPFALLAHDIWHHTVNGHSERAAARAKRLTPADLRRLHAMVAELMKALGQEGRARHDQTD